MITIPNYKVSEASAVYGDYGAQKVAFTLNVNPADVLGSIAGGYAANHVYNKKKDEQLEKEMKSQRIENDSYAQIQSLMQNLKIIFTPINVIFNVNGQVFDIIQADEMNPYMKQAFIQKDADYFRNLLMNKINMELQLAEQAFSQRLLSAGGYGEQTKEATYSSKQEMLIKLAEEEFDGIMKVASIGMESHNLHIDLNFDSLRPFSNCEFFSNPNEIQKVAGVFGIFDHEPHPDEISAHRLNHEVNVGFLPDRVVFTWNGQLIEQMSVLQMNEQGYEAFRNRDKGFFIKLFKEHTSEVEKQTHHEELVLPTKEEEEMPKNASVLEEVIEEIGDSEFSPFTHSIHPFQDPDVHPIAYDMILSSRYGNWARFELEALMKQIEVDFKLEQGIAENPFNKISALYAISHPDHSMFLSPFTFEKFMRTMNSKSIVFEEFQGNLSFGELLFGLEVAKSYSGEEVFWEFHDNIAPYVAEELMNHRVRCVSKRLYDTSNPAEQTFFQDVNGFLLRKWKEFDSQSIMDSDKLERQYILSEQIIEISDEVLSDYVDEINVENPFLSVDSILEHHDLLESVDSEFKPAIKRMVTENVVAQILAALFVEYKHRDLLSTADILKEEGVIHE